MANTLKNLVKTNIKYIVLNANSTIIMDKERTLKYLRKSKKILLSVDITISMKNNININYE